MRAALAILLPLPLAAIALIALATPAGAQTNPAEAATGELLSPPDSGWDLELRPFLWTISMEGDFGAGRFVAPVDISFGDIIDSLNFTAAGSVYANKGKWSVYLEGLYLEAGPDVPSFPRGLLSIDELVIEQALVTGGVFYRIADWDKGFLDIGGGARYTYLANELRLSLGPGPGPIARTITTSQGFVDPFVGFRAKYDVNEKVYLNLAGGIGGFGASSDSIWNLMGGVGYKVKENFAVEFYYRYEELDYDRGPILDVAIQGLFLGFAFSF